MLHTIPSHIIGELPTRFTFPFHYTPHPLCVYAAHKVQTYLSQQEAWHEELAQGKMFGVLIVQKPTGEVGYLAAFSGILAGKNLHDYFVPPVYDLLQPEGFFKQEENIISKINNDIKELENAPKYLLQTELLKEQTECMLQHLLTLKEEMKQAKVRREQLRANTTLTPTQAEELIKESQFLKANYKRQERQWKEKISPIEENILAYKEKINSLRQERKQRSAALQQRLFEQFNMLNIHGESRNLCDIFAHTPQQVPPAGAGECAAPKMLQYAFMQGWKPLAMAEFWWGTSPKTEIRHHGHFYPSCKGKCEPILKHMLIGLEIEDNPLTEKQMSLETKLEILYEDTHLIVLNKPSGMLSVPGKEDTTSIESLIKQRYPQAEGPLIVHRLDMDTSGLLVIALTKEAHKHLQAQFENRTVQKRYIALLEGHPSTLSGEINLPLCLNPLDRPRQMISYEHGKTAITRYEVLSQENGLTRIALYPLTGRTHQLRVHVAHTEGLGCPFVGDALYGKENKRLCLHAETLTFTHPITGKSMSFTKDADF